MWIARTGSSTKEYRNLVLFAYTRDKTQTPAYRDVVLLTNESGHLYSIGAVVSSSLSHEGGLDYSAHRTIVELSLELASPIDVRDLLSANQFIFNAEHGALASGIDKLTTEQIEKFHNRTSMIRDGSLGRQEIPPGQAADVEVLVNQSLEWRVVEGNIHFVSDYNDEDEDTSPHLVRAGNKIRFTDPERGWFSVVNKTTSRSIIEPVHLRDLNDYATSGEPEIFRSLEFPPEYRTAGMAILSYFGRILDEKYPELDVAVSIQQRSNKIKMTVKTPEGYKEVIEKTLDEYRRVVTGVMAPDKLLDDKIAVLELENHLRLVTAQLETQREIGRLKDGNIEVLNRLLASAISKSNVNVIQVDSSSKTSANASVISDFDFEAKLSQTQGALNELAESLPEGGERQEVKEAVKALGNIQGETDPASVKKSSAMSRLRRLLGKMANTDRALGKMIQRARDSLEIAQDIAKAYNDIAKWCGLPQVPRPFLGS